MEKVTHNQRQFIKEIGVVLALTLIIYIKFYKVFKGEATFIMPPDTSDLVYPTFYYIADSLKQGIFPMWDPYQFSGFSLIGSPQFGLFYPLSYLFWMFPFSNNAFPYNALEYMTIFHIFLAGWFMYFLGKGLKFNRYIAFIMAVIYMLNPFINSYLSWVYQIAVFAWFPLIFLFTIYSLDTKKEKNFSFPLIAGILLGVSCLSSLQPSVLIMVFIGFYYIFCVLANRDQFVSLTLNFIVIISLGLMIAAISILPSSELMRYTVRFLGDQGIAIGNQKMSFNSFVEHKMTFKNLFGIIYKPFSDIKIGTTFLGISSFILSLIAIVNCYQKGLVKFLLFMCLFGGAYALGILFPYIFYYVPIVNNIREPVVYIALIFFSMPILCGYSINYLLFDNKFKNKKNVKTYKLLDEKSTNFILVLLGVLLIGLYFCIRYKLYDLTIALLIVSLILILVSLKNRNNKFLKVFFILLVLLEFLFFVPLNTLDNKIVDLDGYYKSFKKLEFLKPKSKEDIFRIHAIEMGKWPYPYNAGNIVNFYDTFGYNNPILYKPFNYRNSIPYYGKLYDMLNIKYFIAYEDSLQRIEPFINENIVFKKNVNNILRPPFNLKDVGSIIVFENTNRVGNAWVVDKLEVVDDSPNIINQIENKVNIEEEALLSRDKLLKETIEEIDTINRNASKLEYIAKIKDYKSNEIIYRVNSNKKAMLITSELYTPGWEVYVNGKRKNILEVNYILRGVVVDKGDSLVEFKYRPKTFYIAMFFSFPILVSTLLLLTILKFVNLKNDLKVKIYYRSIYTLILIFLIYIFVVFYYLK